MLYYSVRRVLRNLVGGWTDPTQLNIHTCQQWVQFSPDFRGEHSKKYSSCHHLAIFRGVGKKLSNNYKFMKISPDFRGEKNPKTIRNLPPVPCCTINHLAIFPGRGENKILLETTTSQWMLMLRFFPTWQWIFSPLTVPTNIKYQMPCGWVKANQENRLVNRGSMETPCVGILRKTGVSIRPL